jgi:murein DD-endopeptidase MepM/ murein hydrolase activator NlpD
MNWRKKRFTFMVIPDANSSVIRFQLSAITLVIGLSMAILLLASAIIIFLLYTENVSQVGQLKHQLSADAGSYEKIIDGKNEHIDELQTEVVGLSEQAKTINTHMNDISKLETELKEMVGLETSDTLDLDKSSSEVNMASNEHEQLSMDGGTGGEELPVTEDEIEMLVDQTRNSFLMLGEQLKQLKPELELTKEEVLKQQELIKITPTIWPTDSRKLSSLFGIRKDPFTRRATYHAGLDISGNTGDPIYAAADGVVMSADFSSSHGNNIWISHSKGMQTHYSHLSKILIEPGAKVSKGDIIGKLGSTGRSTGPHLHYEVSKDGTNIDPLPYLKATRRSN